MTLTDLNIIIKKIGVGLLIFLIPLLIIGGGLFLIQLLLTK